MAIWIFQGNPSEFDIEGYLARSVGTIAWQVNRYSEQMNAGDTVYLWRSQADEPRNAGIVAEATLLESPSVQPEDPLAEQFWKSPGRIVERMRVRLRVNRVATKKEILRREWMKDDSVLRDMLIMRQAAGTNFPVTDDEAIRLRHLWSKTGRDWDRDEVVAALWLYDQTFGQPVSKIAGSILERVSQLIGRTSTGVFNKLMNFRALDPRVDQKEFSSTSKLDAVVWDEFFQFAAGRMESGNLQHEYERLWKDHPPSAAPAYDLIEQEERRLSEKDLPDLLNAYAKRPKNDRPRRIVSVATAYDRDPLVAAIRKRLASYSCEVDGCTSPPIITVSGEQFVEVHHLVPLAQGGPDTLENTAALCPSHHRLVHVGVDGSKVTQSLQEKRKLEYVSSNGSSQAVPETLSFASLSE